MAAGVAALLAAASFAGGFFLLLAGRKKKKRGYKFAGIALFIVCAALLSYLVATLLLLGGIA
jgi:hypothetical protein